MTINSEKLMRIAVAAAEEKKASRIVALNLTGISLVSDYFVICHGNSDTQVQAITTEIKKRVEESGARLRGVEGLDSARWVLIDIGDVVVHVFHRDERDYYNIERLWSDAKVVEFA
ncbi:ribosome silencing factor [Paenibacillus abyssi]|uniref:Ribosomal silencing factor RsfS n=1 Tax=Paenibacillus abyssi TaxID=1340531 RepID=A0A917D560_9BACL|nr:ribosome silencing factor [Paenibacillus abyssi]GGG11061.1 ribosomal silencing factor RsfS [Paenibacillus abyssi]